MVSNLRISKRDLRALPKWERQAELRKAMPKKQSGKTLDQYFNKQK